MQELGATGFGREHIRGEYVLGIRVWDCLGTGTGNGVEL